MSGISDTAALMGIKDLSIAARTMIDGFMNGINKSSVKGAGLEFSQYRSYQPGDDLRWLDWKMFARSDRYYIRESEVETNISIRLMLDASASMAHDDRGLSKIQYGRVLAASLAYLAQLQGDAAGLYVFREGGLQSLPSKQDYQHLSRIFHQLENIVPGGKITPLSTYKDIYSGTRKRELLILITDFYQEQNEIIDLVDSLNSLKNEIIVFHLMGKNELSFDFKGYTTLEDYETGRKIRIDTAKLGNEYESRLNAHLTQVRAQMLERNIHYRLIPMNELPYAALRDYLNRRKKNRT